MRSIPRHVIERLGALHFLGGLLEAAQVPVSDGGLSADERSRCKVIMRRVAASCHAALRLEPQAEGEKEIRRVRNAINRMNAALWSAWAENVDAREAVMAAMCMVAEQQEELDRLWNEGKISGPQAQLKRMEWALLHSLLMDWLEALDPDFEDGPIQHGDAVGERLKQALAGA